MKRSLRFLITGVLFLLTVSSCKKNNDNTDDAQDGLDKIVIINNINTGSTQVAYLGTRRDLSPGSYNNTKAQQVVSYPLAQVYNNDVFLIEARSGDRVIKYTRNTDGTLQPAGSLTMPAAAYPHCIAFESATKAYLTLGNTGKIVVVNPSTMGQIGTIDLTAYAIGDGSPDPGVILYRDGKLYVGCVQTSDGTTSSHPAQLLIIDLNDNNKITSITDNRTTMASNASSEGSMFFDESGDLYVLCMASWGVVPGQKCGFLRIKNGESNFDPSYFFNITDYTIDDIPGSHLSYFHRMEHAGNGIVYGVGNIPALMSNPPDYVLDKTFAAFKLNLANKTVTKINIPYSNGYSACVMSYENKVYFGMSTNTGVGIYLYDPATNSGSPDPVVATQGDPSILCSFKN